MEGITTQLNSLALSHSAAEGAARGARWLQVAAPAAGSLPLYLALDLGRLLTEAEPRLERPAHLPPDLPDNGYLRFLQGLQHDPRRAQFTRQPLGDEAVGLLLAKVAGGVAFPGYVLPPGGDFYARLADQTRLICQPRLADEVRPSDIAALWRALSPAERPDFPPEAALSQMAQNWRRLDPELARYLARYGAGPAARLDPRQILNRFHLLNLPPELAATLRQMLRLIPRVSEGVSNDSAQTY
ncbi:MAG: hypothetical protein GY798_32040, partial [Hyphomicrobiales bacterium]|nr:hypothetical protein [Hyphomicrobiales bacterium]